jgi:hypothetical protein
MAVTTAQGGVRGPSLFGSIRSVLSDSGIPVDVGGVAASHSYSFSSTLFSFFCWITAPLLLFACKPPLFSSPFQQPSPAFRLQAAEVPLQKSQWLVSFHVPPQQPAFTN